MATLDELRSERIKKLNSLKEKGINPYPTKTNKEFTLAEVASDFAKLSKRKKPIAIAGRIMAIRSFGGSIFADLYDGTATFQVYLKKDEIGDELFSLFAQTIDIGDFIEASGSLFVTKKEEKSLLASNWNILSKSLRPLPEKWHGLQDVEERFRRRYLDTLMNPEAKERFIVRSQIIQLVRAFYIDEGFLEVDPPILQALAGGATAEPFKTHHNALQTDFYLTIAQELYLKELIIGGYNKVFEMGKRFRNEGIDVTHNPEFTMLESNEAYADAEDLREFTEKLFKFVVKKLFGTLTFSYDENEIDVKPKFAVITFYDLLRRHALIQNPESISQEDAILKAQQLGVKVDPKDALDKILDNIYKKVARPKLIQPTFIIDYPVSFNPFAKRKENDDTLIDRFQLVIGGVELVNAFAELNNPLDQKDRYLEQDKKGKGGEKEISPSDQEYLEAMEYGMPPNGGIGIGIDRLVMLLTNTKNIREVIIFPTLRPK
jgi:lysyl-tRNA synthetase class 2